MSAKTLSFHHFLKGAILLGFAVYIAYLAKTDRILYYIAPRMADYVKWSAVAFYAMAVYQIYNGIIMLWGTRQPDCDCEHLPSTSVLKNTLLYGLFVLPLAFGFLLPDASMGSSLAAKKGVNLNSASSLKSSSALPAGTGGTNGTPGGQPSKNAAAGASDLDAKRNELFPSDKFTEHYAKFAMQLYQLGTAIPVKDELYMETLTTIDLYLNPFIGKKLEISGFVHRESNMAPNQFVVGRFAVSCCSADASPFGVLADYSRASTLQNDTWVKVTGTIQKTKFVDNEVMQLKVEKVEKITPPTTQYVYPNYDFGR